MVEQPTEEELIAFDKALNESKNSGLYDKVEAWAAARMDILEGARDALIMILVGLAIGFGPGLVAKANAGTIAHMPNLAGGRIMLSDADCSNNTGTGIVISNMPTGEVISGCWTYDSETLTVRVVWASGAIKIFNSDQFTFTPYAIQKYLPEQTSRPIRPSAPARAPRGTNL